MIHCIVILVIYIHTHLTVGHAFTPCLNVEAFGLMVSANRFLECHHAPWLSFCAVHSNGDCRWTWNVVRFGRLIGWWDESVNRSVKLHQLVACNGMKHLICKHKNLWSQRFAWLTACWVLSRQITLGFAFLAWKMAFAKTLLSNWERFSCPSFFVSIRRPTWCVLQFGFCRICGYFHTSVTNKKSRANIHTNDARNPAFTSWGVVVYLLGFISGWRHHLRYLALGFLNHQQQIRWKHRGSSPREEDDFLVEAAVKLLQIALEW